MTPMAAQDDDPIVTGGVFIDFAIHLTVDVVAVVILAGLIYYRRHNRRDLLTTIVCFNISIFVVLAVITERSAGLGVGFGLFALLSIINLRSDPFSTIELTYFFSGLVIGVVNSLEVGGGYLNWPNEAFAILLSGVVVLAAYLADHPRLQKAAGHQQITLDQVVTDPGQLRAALEQRLGVIVTNATVLHVSYVEETMLVDIRFIRRPGDTADDVALGSL